MWKLIFVGVLSTTAFANEGPGTLTDAVKNAQLKVAASQIAAWGFREGKQEALKSLEGYPTESCVENNIMAAEALIELQSASNCLRARGFAYEYQKIKSVHCKPTSMAIAESSSKAFHDSLRRCMQMGFLQCEIDSFEHTPTSDGYCIVRVTTRPMTGADRETSKLIRARDLLVEARELMDANDCPLGAERGLEAKKQLESMQLTVIPDYPNGRVPAYFCDDF
jgi:hypothetical protein